MTATLNGTKRLNPYVGPRAFRTGERLYGREHETAQLLDLLIAERIVLLYSPSGAGKTSLIQASLLPRLQQEDFVVLPPMRVNQDLTGLDRYILSALLSLEESLPPEQRMPLNRLAGLTLDAYLDSRSQDTRTSQVLLFDQFEEILTVDPTNLPAKEAFFTQVGEALRNRTRWALFSMREDYIAGLDPYLRRIPTRLANTFRLDLLAVNAARLAIQEPARAVGVDFTDAAADKLLDDLRRVQTQRSDGTVEQKPGPYIEPVQLQVVCLRLWDKLAPDDVEITESDVAQIGDVNTALADYYADRVNAIVTATGERERAIREWFDRQLITEHGLRGQVLMEPERSRGLSNRAIRLFEDAHLVRAEERRGTTWFELSHDRLVEPIHANNAAWFQQHLSTLQRQADLWNTQGRQAGLLLRDQALTDAEQWANRHAAELTETEQDFLRECREERLRVERERRANSRIRRLAVVASVLTVLAILLAGSAGLFWNQASQSAGQNATLAVKNAEVARQAQAASTLAVEKANAAATSESNANANANAAVTAQAIAQANANTAATAQAEAIVQRDAAERAKNDALTQNKLATSRELAANAIALLQFDPEFSLLLSMRAIQTAETEQAVDALRQSLTESHILSIMRGHIASVNAAAFSPDGKLVVTAGDDSVARIWDTNSGNLKFELRGHSGPVYCAQFSPDGKWVVTGSGSSKDPTARLWNVSTGQNIFILSGHRDLIWDVHFSSDGKQIVTASNDRTARVWDLSTGSLVSELRGHTSPIWHAEFSPDGKWVVTASGDKGGGGDKTARVWEASTGKPIAVLQGHRASVLFATFSRDGKYVASSSVDGGIGLWEAATGNSLYTIIAHSDQVWMVNFSPDGQYVVTASHDKSALGLHVRTGQMAFDLRGHTESIVSASFDPTGRSAVLTASLDGTARVWDLVTLRTIANLRGHTAGIRSASFSPNGKLVLTASDDGTARVWDLRPPVDLVGRTGSIERIRFSPDGKSVLAVDSDDKGYVWDARTGKLIQEGAGIQVPTQVATTSADGKFELGTGGDCTYANCDTTLRVWTTKPVNTIFEEFGASPILDAAFSPDAKQIAAAYENGSARVFACDVCGSTDELVALAKTRVTRDFTCGERLTYLHETIVCPTPIAK